MWRVAFLILCIVLLMGCQADSRPQDFAYRVKAAQRIEQGALKDQSFSQIAMDAAAAADAETAQSAVAQIANMDLKDRTAANAAVRLHKNGKREAAFALADSISNIQLRDRVMARLSGVNK